MNDFINRYGVVVCALSLFACQANGDTYPSWKSDGTVIDGKGNEIKLDLVEIDDGLVFDNDLFVIGYRNDKDNKAHYFAVKTSSHSSNPEYWPFDGYLRDLFVYKNRVYINDFSGTVYSLNGSQWIATDIHLQPYSIIVESDKDDIIACSPTNLTKQNYKMGACYAVNQGWAVDANWHGTPYPKVCNGHINVLEDENKKGLFVKVINLTDGKILSVSPVNKEPSDLCNP